ISNVLSSSVNTLSSTVADCTASTANIINTNTLALNATTNELTSSVNGVAGTVNLSGLNTNIYTHDGTLAANRTVTMANNSLQFVNGYNTTSFNNNETMAHISATGSSRGNITLNGGNATVDLYVDNSAAAQLTIRGQATSLHVGSTTGQAKPLHLITNGLIRATVTGTGEVAIGAPSAPSFVVGGSTIQPKLHVAGDISTTGKLWTTNSVYADYVFEKYFDGESEINNEYEFKSLDYIKEFVEKNKHLP